MIDKSFILSNSDTNKYVGKSVCLSYILAHRLYTGEPTVYRLNDDCCYLFDDDTPGVEMTAKCLFQLSNKKKSGLWILTDEALTDARWKGRGHPWFVVLGASPAKVRLSRDWEKDRNVGVHFISPWSWAEIFAAYRY